jgi:hypothetical protein
MMMGAHPNIASVSEITGPLDVSHPLSVSHPREFLCSCGVSLADCQFWREVAAKMRLRYEDFDLANFKTRYVPVSARIRDRLQYAYLRSDILERLRDQVYMRLPRYRVNERVTTERNLALAEAILDVTGKTVLFDASKSPARIGPLYRALGNKLKVVHLIRDGRAVTKSFVKHGPHTDIGIISDIWRRSNAEAEIRMQRIPKENRCTVRYEDIISNPEREIRRVLDMAGLEYSDRCLNFGECELHVLGNAGTRLKNERKVIKTATAPELENAREAEVFRRRAGEMNERYGYR